MYKMEDDEREGLGCFGAATENILVPQFTSIFACQLPLLPCSTAEQLHGPIPREDVKRMKDEVLANSNFWLSTAEDALEFTRTGFVGGHLFRGHVRGDTTKVLQDIQRRTKQVRSDTALGQERVFFTCFAPPPPEIPPEIFSPETPDLYQRRPAGAMQVHRVRHARHYLGCSVGLGGHSERGVGNTGKAIWHMCRSGTSGLCCLWLAKGQMCAVPQYILRHLLTGTHSDG